MRNIILILLIMLACLAGCQTTTLVEPSLEDAILQTIVSEGGLEEDYAIIAHMDREETTSWGGTVIKVWRYQNDEFEVVDEQLYHDAMGEDRSKWPADTFEFSINKQSNKYAEVEVTNHYDMGILPDSRGGNWSIVTFQRSDSGWEAEWTIYELWD